MITMRERNLLCLTPHISFNVDEEAVNLETDDVVMCIRQSVTSTMAALQQLCEPQWSDELVVNSELKARLTEHRALCEFPVHRDRPDRFIHHFLNLCDDWATGIFESVFWQRFMSGQSSRAQVFAFLAQLHHRTAGADLHNYAAAQSCSDSSIRILLQHHYEEELGHARILASGIRGCGIDGELALVAPPLAETGEFIDFMLRLSDSPHAYMGCYGIFHAPATIKTEAELMLQFDNFSRLYPFASTAFEAVARHARLDYHLGHQDVDAVRWVRSGGRPSADEMRAMACGAREAAWRLRKVFDAIALIE